MTKKYFILSFLLISVSLGSIQAQTKRQVINDKVKSMRIAFITTKLDLSPEESQKFWPVYNQYDAERHALMQDKADLSKEFATDSEANAYLVKHLEMRERELALEKKYIEKLKATISTRKVAKLMIAEKQFRQEIMSSIIEKRKEKQK